MDHFDPKLHLYGCIFRRKQVTETATTTKNLHPSTLLTLQLPLHGKAQKTIVATEASPKYDQRLLP